MWVKTAVFVFLVYLLTASILKAEGCDSSTNANCIETNSNTTSTVNSNRLTYEYVPNTVTNIKHAGSSYANTTQRATVSEFGPVLLSRILDLSEVQSGIVAILFKYCDDKKLPVRDLKDFKNLKKACNSPSNSTCFIISLISS